MASVLRFFLLPNRWLRFWIAQAIGGKADNLDQKLKERLIAVKRSDLNAR